MFEALWKKILRRKPYSLLALPALLLWLLSLVYRLISYLYRVLPRQRTRLAVPVISIGSISVGGAGKTPLVHRIAVGLEEEGVQVGIVSSGYGRSSKEPILAPGYVVREMGWAACGDEVKLLAVQLPNAIFSVHQSKTVAASRLAEAGGVDVIIVDDGFQHYGLARDLDIVAYDTAHKPHLLKMFPYGVLRESRRALKRADIIIITRAKFSRDITKLRRRLGRLSPRAEIFHAGFSAELLVSKNTENPIKYLEDKSVFLFAGVGNFRPLRKQVTALSADLDHALELSDHQIYDEHLLQHIKAMAEKYDSDLILTTGKDWVKLGDFDFGREAYYLDLLIDLDPGEEKLIRQIMQKLDLKRTER